ncbi:hypothetical protein LINGRAHAP2_LOCUS30572, partial [Linum grandiflorum]
TPWIYLLGLLIKPNPLPLFLSSNDSSCSLRELELYGWRSSSDRCRPSSNPFWSNSPVDSSISLERNRFSTSIGSIFHYFKMQEVHL